MSKYAKLLDLKDREEFFKELRNVLIDLINGDPKEYYEFLDFLENPNIVGLKDSVEEIIKSGQSKYGISVGHAMVMWHYDYDHPGFLDNGQKEKITIDASKLTDAGRDALVEKFGVEKLMMGMFS